jgi:CheY-like chemotaxis protein
MKVCFILSSIGGPRMLPQVFAGTLRDDVAYVVIQRLAGAGLLDVLVECLREELNRKTLIAGHNLPLQPGAIHFLPNERNYVLQGDSLAAAPGAKGSLDLDMLFASAAARDHACAVAVLSGMLMQDEGLDGLAKLAARGAPIVGTLESQTPVFDMIDRIRSKGLMGELYPPKNMLEHLDPGLPKPRAAGADGTAAPRYLIADDEEKVRSMLVEMLKLHGIAAECAVDGLDALRKIQKGRYDALILDLAMPEMDGIKTLEALKTIDPGLPIVVMTGSEDSARIQAAKEFKVLGVLQKPFSWDKLKKFLPIA